MPANLTPGLKYAIKVQGEGGVNFSNYTTVDFNPKYSSIMIQTDKAIYKPGQTSMYSAPLILYNSSINKFFFIYSLLCFLSVHFRVFGMYPDLTLVNDNIDVEIYVSISYYCFRYLERYDRNEL